MINVRLVKCVHHFYDKKYEYTRKYYSNGKFKEIIIKGDVDITKIEKWNNKQNIGISKNKKEFIRNIEFSYAYNINVEDSFLVKIKETNNTDFLSDDFEHVEKVRTHKQKRNINPIVVDNVAPIKVDDIITDVLEEDTFNKNYNTCFIRRGNRAAQLIHFQSLNTNIVLDYNTVYEVPVVFNDGVSNDGEYVELFCKLGNDKLIGLLKSYVSNDKKILNKIFNVMNKEVVYLFACNIMNKKIEHKDITANLILQSYLMIMKQALENAGYEYFYLDMKELKFQSQKFAKKFYNGNIKNLLCGKGILNEAFKTYGKPYNGVRYPKGWNNDEKAAYKVSEGIERKKHNKHKDSKEELVRDCFDKGMKQKDVVELLGINKGAVSKYYKRFKCE